MLNLVRRITFPVVVLSLAFLCDVLGQRGSSLPQWLSAAAVILLLLHLVAQDRAQEYGLPSAVGATLAAAFAYLLASAFTGAYAHVHISMLVPLMGFGLATVFAARHPRQLPLIAIVVGVVATLQLGLMAWGFSLGQLANGLYLDENLPALVVGCAGILLLAVSRDVTRARKALAVWGVLLILGATVSGSRGYVLAMLVTAGTLGWAIWANQLPAAARRRAWLFVLGALVVGAALVTSWVLLGDKDYSSLARVDMWRSSLEMLWASGAPFTGVGLGSWYLLYPQYRTALDIESSGQHAHNDYVEVLAETGLIGLALLLALVAFNARALLQSRDSTAGVRLTAERLAAAGFLYFSLHLFVNFALYMLSAALVGGLLLGRSLRTTRQPSTTTWLTRLQLPARAAGGAVVVALGVFVMWYPTGYVASFSAFNSGSLPQRLLPWLGSTAALEFLAQGPARHLVSPQAEASLHMRQFQTASYDTTLTEKEQSTLFEELWTGLKTTQQRWPAMTSSLLMEARLRSIGLKGDRLSNRPDPLFDIKADTERIIALTDAALGVNPFHIEAHALRVHALLFADRCEDANAFLDDYRARPRLRYLHGRLGRFQAELPCNLIDE